MRSARSSQFAGRSLKTRIQNILLGLMLLDLWILINVGRLAKKIANLFKPMMEVALLLILGITLLSILALSVLKLEVTGLKCYKTEESMKSVRNELLGITDESGGAHTIPKYEREISNLKKKALTLELAVRRMQNSQLRTFNMRCKEEEPADFASEAAGASVLDTPDTESYYEPTNSLKIFGIPLCRPHHFTPRKVIQPWSEPGECWAFRGSQGNVKIGLAYPVIMTHVTLQHISATASLTGKIDSAPRDFQVRALLPERSAIVGTYVYNQHGPSSQTFPVTEDELKTTPVSTVALEVLSNWGNPNYTCIYRFKVHGRINL